MSHFLFMGEQEDPEFDTIEARGNVRIYDGMEPKKGTARTAYVECGCGRRYVPAEFMALTQVGVQEGGGFTGGDLLLANCACGSTISMEAE